MKHPMQYQEVKNGVQRFVENKLISWLVDQLPNGLNALSIQHQQGNYSDDDYDQILQLIGYSVSGIPYRDKEKYNVTDNNEKPEEHYEKRLKELKAQLAPIVEDLFNTSVED